MRRQWPRPAETAALVRLERPALPSLERRLARALTIDDLRDLARRRAPRFVFDYADGGAEDEISMARARDAFRDLELRPGVLRDVSSTDTSREVLGRRQGLPFGFAPIGFTRLLHAAGEVAGARAASDARIPFVLSTLGTTTVEDVAAAAPDARLWFQLYMWRDRGRSMALVDRAAAAGCDALVVTVDTPIGGARLRDTRNGMTFPPALRLRTVFDAARRPAWWLDFLTTQALGLASLESWDGTVAELAAQLFDPSVTLDDVAWLRERWPGKLVVKGVQTVADARRIAEAGADAITLSNHGGRQLDRAPVPLQLLSAVRGSLPAHVEVHLDSGVRSGADVVAALALGARLVYVGRAYVYGLMAGGEAGARRAVEILESQVIRTMRLLGVASTDELSPEHVDVLPRPVAAHDVGRIVR